MNKETSALDVEDVMVSGCRCKIVPSAADICDKPDYEIFKTNSGGVVEYCVHCGHDRGCHEITLEQERGK